MLTAETRPLLRTDAARNEAEMKTETLTAGARPLIPHNRPLITDADIAAVSGTLASGWIAQGPQTRAFEEEVCAFLGLEGDAVAVSSGTTALHLALLALGVGPEDAVILPTYVCSAVLNAVCHAGAAPVLADVSPNDFNLDPAHVHALLTARTKAIIAPHTYGFPADIGALRALGVPVVEDCAQAIGAAVAGRKAGTLGDIAIFSFYATKLMTTGQGGMVVGPRTLMETVRDLRDFDCRPTYRVRYNYQMTDFQAALGRSQLARLPERLARRAAIAARYRCALPSGWRAQEARADAQPVYYRFVLVPEVENSAEKGSADWPLDYFAAEGIRAIRPIATYELLHRYLRHSPPVLPNPPAPFPEREGGDPDSALPSPTIGGGEGVGATLPPTPYPLHPAHGAGGEGYLHLNPADFPNAERLAAQAVSLPLYPGLTDDEVEHIARALERLP